MGGDVSDDGVSSAGDRGEVRAYRRRMPVFTDGDACTHLHVVEVGRVKLVASQASGRETILDIVEPGRVVCSGAFLQGQGYCCTAVADSDGTQVRAISREAVCAALGETSPLVFELLDAATARAERMCRRVREVTSGSVPQRVAALLARLARERSATSASPSSLRLTRQDIADLCGTTVESAIRAMRTLERAGLVSSTSDGIVVHDVTALARRSIRAR